MFHNENKQTNKYIHTYIRNSRHQKALRPKIYSKKSPALICAHCCKTNWTSAVSIIEGSPAWCQRQPRRLQPQRGHRLCLRKSRPWAYAIPFSQYFKQFLVIGGLADHKCERRLLLNILSVCLSVCLSPQGLSPLPFYLTFNLSISTQVLHTTLFCFHFQSIFVIFQSSQGSGCWYLHGVKR